MNPFRVFVFMCFILPAVMLKALWDLITDGITSEDWKKWLWRLPYFLIVLLAILALVLWMKGYR